MSVLGIGMPTRLFVLGALSVALLAACASAPADEDGAELDASELQAMAAPGVDETALNRAADPCIDFYEFACGGYIASLPADTQRDVRSFTQLQKAHSAILDRVLDEMVSAPKNDAERKAGTLFSTCMAGDAITKSAAFLASFRPEIEAATTPGALAELLARMHRRGASVFFSIYPGGEGRTGSVAAYANGNSGIKSDADRQRVLDGYVRTIKQIEPTLDDAAVTRLATGAVKIDEALSKAEAASQDDEASHPLGRPGLELTTPSLDWKAYFQMLGRTSLGDFPVYGVSYFAALDQILTTSDIADIHAYLVARYYSSASRLIAAGADRKSYCERQLQGVVADVIEPRFLELAGVDAKAKAKARALWNGIVSAFDEELQEEPFLDTATRIEARMKLKDMRGAIAASRTLDDLGGLVVSANDSFLANYQRVRERDFAQGLAQVGHQLPLLHVDFPAPVVNASYDGSLNKINVPGGILGGYFFSPSSPNLANFAAIGAVLGHELTHGFDNNGRHLDGKGMERDWWTASVDAAFKQRAQCMADEYSAFTLPGVPDPVTGVAPGHINGEQTLGENIADNGGLKTAYRASKVAGMTAPVVAGFTPPQQFFLSFGQLWCGKSSPQAASQQLSTDVHSPEKARVNVPLQNMEAFAAAFSCGAGTPMAPANRCGVW
jgi:predicted metalloendopeptidase